MILAPVERPPQNTQTATLGKGFLLYRTVHFLSIWSECIQCRSPYQCLIRRRLRRGYAVGSSNFSRTLCFKWFSVSIKILRLVYKKHFFCNGWQLFPDLTFYLRKKYHRSYKSSFFSWRDLRLYSYFQYKAPSHVAKAISNSVLGNNCTYYRLIQG